MKKAIFTVVRAIIGIVLAILLIRWTLQGSDMNINRLWANQIQQAIMQLLLLTIMLYGTVLFIGALRWRLLLRAQDINLGYLPVLRLTLTGFFFNLAIPGAVGGDLVKMGYAMRRAPENKTAAVFSIVVDRIMGIMGLFVVAGVAVLLNLQTIIQLGEENPYLQAGAVLVALGSFAGVIGLLALQYHYLLVRHPKLAPLWDLCSRKLPRAIVFTAKRIMTALDLYKKSKKVLAQTLGLAILIHCILALNLFTIGQALHENKLSLGDYFVTTQVANAVAAVPVTPGGLGLRDKGAQELFSALGMAEHKSGAIPVTLTFILLLWALIGGAVFTVAPVSTKPPDQE